MCVRKRRYEGVQSGVGEEERKREKKKKKNAATAGLWPAVAAMFVCVSRLFRSCHSQGLLHILCSKTQP